MRRADYIIIGGGVNGLNISREISAQKMGSVILLDKESELGMHQSGRSSGVKHSGINQKPGTLKAKLCVSGSQDLGDYCRENDIPIQETGTLVVASNKKEREILRELYSDAVACGVPGVVSELSYDEFTKIEPRAKGLEALFSPTGAIIDAHALLRSLENQAWGMGVEIVKGAEVTGIRETVIETTKGDFTAKHIINCAGLQADIIAHMMGVRPDLTILPFLGMYLEVPADINSMIYSAPDRKFPFLGVHLTRTMEGKVIAGPTATLSFGGREDYERQGGLAALKEMIRTPNFLAWTARTLLSPSAVGQVYHNLRLSSSAVFLDDVNKIYDEKINPEDVRPYRAGIRAQLVSRSGKLVNDFLIEMGEYSTNLLNGVSPGLTSSMALAKYITKHNIPRVR
ncbi:L-2-hydroxyglutarate oxidase [Candidatus Pacearchaeota archaeon]|nr:L-2-hydroxyglutarate oxidase [Candidatus Pacearchaeota archaeon]